jgi:hypothetical protein
MAMTLTVAGVLAAMGPSTSRADDGFAISQHQIASGGISRAHSDCFDLSATLGQAAIGVSSGGAFDLVAGFWATQTSAGTDSIFNESFEDCQP